LRRDRSAHENNAQIHLSMAVKTVLQLKNDVTVLKKNAVTFTLENFTDLKSSGKHYYSPEIYTSSRGYKLRLCIRTNSEDKKYLSAHALVMKGDYDAQLQWPFTGTVNIELLNQIEDKNHHSYQLQFPANSEVGQRVVGAREYGTKMYGNLNFISLFSLSFDSGRNCQYLMDDKLVFRYTVDDPHYKPWLENTSNS